MTNQHAADSRGDDVVSRVAVLNTRYPALSHTFIEREIRAIRAAGLDVLTISVRRPEEADRLCETHRQAERETQYVLDGVGKLLLALLRCLVTRPWRVLRTLIRSQRLSPPGCKARLWHLFYWIEAARLVCILRDHGISHVHVHMANNGASVALLACTLDRSLSYSLTMHGSSEFFNMAEHRLREKARGAAFVRCISNFCRAQMMFASRIQAVEHFPVVHCGVDVSRFAPRPPLPPGTLRLLTVGRFDPVKGYNILLLAIKRLVDARVRVHLTMIGAGSTQLQVRNQVRALRLGGVVTFAGPVGQDHIREFYTEADALVVSSFMEGIPVVLMEAMAMELAVVSTNVAGIPELVEHGVSGLLVEPGCPEKLAGALETLARDRNLMHRMGKAGRDRIVRDFNIERIGVEIAKLLRGTAGARHVPVGKLAAKAHAAMPTAQREPCDVAEPQRA